MKSRLTWTELLQVWDSGDPAKTKHKVLNTSPFNRLWTRPDMLFTVSRSIKYLVSSIIQTDVTKVLCYLGCLSSWHSFLWHIIYSLHPHDMIFCHCHIVFCGYNEYLTRNLELCWSLFHWWWMLGWLWVCGSFGQTLNKDEGEGSKCAIILVMAVWNWFSA